jgi:hypothetical protein
MSNFLLPQPSPEQICADLPDDELLHSYEEILQQKTELDNVRSVRLCPDAREALDELLDEADVLISVIRDEMILRAALSYLQPLPGETRKGSFGGNEIRPS